MAEALEQWLYRDPQEILERLERRDRRESEGRAGCRFRGGHLAWDKYECGIRHEPGRRGFCDQWRELEAA